MKKFTFLSRLLSQHIGIVFGYAGIFLIAGPFLTSIRGHESTDHLFDLIRTTGPRQEVAIIGIDDASLKEYGAWPWNRKVFAELITKLDASGVRASVFDVLFLEPREGDEDLKTALATSTHTVILASKVEDGAYLSSYIAGSTTPLIISALANVTPDSDGKVRKYPTGFIHQESCIRSLSQEAFSVYTKKEAPCDTKETQFRYPGTVPIYSLVDVIRGTTSPELLKDKVVFIGSTSLGLEDHFVGMKGGKVPGVYIHASAFTSYLNNISDTRLPGYLGVLLLIVCMSLGVYALYTIRRPLFQIISIAGIILVIIILGVVAYTAGIILPVPPLIFGVIGISAYAALVRFLEERKQNEFIEQVFSKYVHKDILKELLASGKEVSLGGERKQLTVLFSDIRGFTTLSESLTPEELTRILNAYLSDMTPHILEEKGTIDKFIGDAIMAFWNAPLEVPNHPLHAVRAALRMHDALKTFNVTHGTSLAAGIGLHTGFAVVGNVGGKDRVNYTILGDTVNLTSRLEGLTKKYGVATIITMAVKDAINDPHISFRCLDVITVAGKTTPTTLYEVRRAGEFADGVIENYEKAFKHYYQGEWGKAEKLFQKLAKEGDYPSEKMLARIPELRTKEAWDGVWRFDEK